uniref:Uncharacterized protein LOC111133345 n=1 Tax=Crassostrea virginica TaxID=6565 RepID=A0A8B8E9N0_CRAVI|nr:uncharacterized protein LOC111133345 [Crassostrea virginica]XP_022337362.1 uncharacterized protein LOC111133345 [Crassostrea virginica]
MAKAANDQDSTTTASTATPVNPGYRDPDGDVGRSSTDTVAAITVAILAVIIVITCVLVARAIRKRRRARQGTRMDQPIPTISTGVMGTSAAAYSHVHISQSDHSSAVSWEPIETQQHSQQTSHDSFPDETSHSANISSNVSSDQPEEL